MSNPPCACGCGQPVIKPTARILPGHNRDHPVGQPCRVPDCDRPVDAHGLCHAHDVYKRRTGKEPTQPVRAATMEERFWAKVNKNGPIPAVRPDLGPCWLWTASTDGRGRYGAFARAGRKLDRAHRVAYELANGPVSPGLDLDHLCKVTLCVNPSHLEAVTHAENVHRGDAPTALNRSKTHCPRGHEYDMVTSNGGRWCRTCSRESARERQRLYRARKRQAP